MKHPTALLLSLSLCAALLFGGFPATIRAAEAETQNWPRLRGPNGSGVAAGLSIPAAWKDADFRWQIDLPGIGNGSPVVWGDRIFLLSASEPAPVPRGKGKGKGKGKKKGAGQTRLTRQTTDLDARLCQHQRRRHPVATRIHRGRVQRTPLQQSRLDHAGGR